MGKIPKALLAELLADPYYKKCAREDENCGGRLTFDHCIIYAGKQVQEKWAIIPVCWTHHLGRYFHRNTNTAIALSRATDEDLAMYPKMSVPHMRALQKLFLPPKKRPGRPAKTNIV